MIFVGLLAAYIVVGVISALVWGRAAWSTDYGRELMDELGYEGALDRVKRGKVNLLVGWPVVIPVVGAAYFFIAVLDAFDPHRKHQAEFAKAMAGYHELTELEQQAKLEITAQMPQRWCPCLASEAERDPHEVEIQRRVEIELKREAIELGEGSRQFTSLMEIRRRLIHLGMWE